mgnify:CR=1 FL=1
MEHLKTQLTKSHQTMKKQNLDLQKIQAFLATDNPPSALKAAEWTPSDLKEVEKEFNSIPKIKNIYTKLLSEIESKQRLHNQSMFGPACDPKTNLCSTPMCTAGHLVNMCGEIGYKLKQKYSFPVAAKLIHIRNRPDVPPQNFGYIPQDFAMAYIRERAAEEQVGLEK